MGRSIRAVPCSKGEGTLVLEHIQCWLNRYNINQRPRHQRQWSPSVLEGPLLVVGRGFNLPMQVGLRHVYAHCQPPCSLENLQRCSSSLQPSVLLSSSGLLWLAGTSCRKSSDRHREAKCMERDDPAMTAECLPPWNKCKTIVMIQLQLLF